MIELPVVTVSVTGADPTKAIQMDNWMYDAWDQEREKKFEFGILGDRNRVVISYPKGVGLLPDDLRGLEVTEIRLVDGQTTYLAKRPELIRQVLQRATSVIKPNETTQIHMEVLRTMWQP